LYTIETLKRQKERAVFCAAEDKFLADKISSPLDYVVEHMETEVAVDPDE
jgi:hypothetical protein